MNKMDFDWLNGLSESLIRINLKKLGGGFSLG